MLSFSSITLALSLSAFLTEDAFGRVVLPRSMKKTNVLSARTDLQYCGTTITSAEVTTAEEQFEATKRSFMARADLEPNPNDTTRATSGRIPVVFNVIYANETFDGGYIPSQDIEAQIAVLNQAYITTGFSFYLDGFTYVQNADWFTKAGFKNGDTEGLAVVADIKKSLRKGNVKTLNVYTVKQVPIKDNILGVAAFPHDFQTDPTNDGIFLLHTSLPNSPAVPYNLGITLVHEVGHWMGLYHTFQGGCEELGGGDRVVDTPAVAVENSGCPAGIDTCIDDQGIDLINNYMDYTDDSCLNEFTLGQIFRMQDQMRAYRGVDVVGQ